MKNLCLALAGLLLSGCILQSDIPAFSDAQGQFMLGRSPVSYQDYSLEKGNWKKQGNPVRFTPNGKHYVATEKNSNTAFTFVHVAREWWVAQMQEFGKPAIYVFANAQPDAIYIHPLTCHNLTYNGAAQKSVTFAKDDCFLKPNAGIADVQALLTASGPRTLKLVRLK